MEGWDLPEGLKWILGTLASLLVALGGVLGWSKVREIREQRRYAVLDKREATAEANKVADAQKEIRLVEILEARVNKLEERLEKQGEMLMALTKSEATLTATNEALRRELDQKNREIEKLQEESTSRAGRITVLEKEILELKAQIQEMLAIQRGEV